MQITQALHRAADEWRRQGAQAHVTRTLLEGGAAPGSLKKLRAKVRDAGAASRCHRTCAREFAALDGNYKK